MSETTTAPPELTEAPALSAEPELTVALPQPVPASPRLAAPATPADNPLASLYREPAAARVALRLIGLNLLQALLGLALAVGCLYLYQRRPERILIKETATGEQTLQVDNRSYGDIANLSLTPDKPTKGQMVFAAKEFARLLYEVDLDTRPKQLQRAFGMMAPSAAQTLFGYLQKNETLPNLVGFSPKAERAETWAATVDLKEVTADARDPLAVTLLADQTITKNLNGTVSQSTRRIQLFVKLLQDPARRNDANLQTGFQIVALTFKELPR